MPFAYSALAWLSKDLSCETGSFSCRRNPCSILQLVLSFQFPVQPALPGLSSLLPCCASSLFACLSPISTPPTSLGECFFNSLVVGVPFSLIFWQFWLFTVFRLVVILPLVVQGNEAFLPTPSSWLELSISWFSTRFLQFQLCLGSLSQKTILLSPESMPPMKEEWYCSFSWLEGIWSFDHFLKF